MNITSLKIEKKKQKQKQKLTVYFYNTFSSIDRRPEPKNKGTNETVLCETNVETNGKKRKTYDEYSFYDIFVQTVNDHVGEQPSNKRRFPVEKPDKKCSKK